MPYTMNPATALPSAAELLAVSEADLDLASRELSHLMSERPDTVAAQIDSCYEQLANQDLQWALSVAQQSQQELVEFYCGEFGEDFPWEWPLDAFVGVL